MDAASTAAFTLFAAVAAFTPGPNNVMLASSGATFGFIRRCRTSLGSSRILFWCLRGLGLGVLAAFPTAHMLLRIAGVLFFTLPGASARGRPQDCPAAARRVSGTRQPSR